MRRSKVTPNSVLTPVNYDRKTGVYNNPLTPVSLDQKTGEVTDPYHPAGYDSRSGMYYDGFAQGGGEYVTPKEFAQTYGLRALAEGGYVQAGEPVIVGDGGQSEYFVPDNGGQYQGNYQRMMDYINSGKRMDMAPQPAIPYSDEYFQANYNTPIPAEKAQDYDLWKFQQSRKMGRDVTGDNIDYDVQGFYMKNAQQSGNGHGPDTFKKPNHPTFSDQSQYHGLDGYEGGHWGENSFTPSLTNQVMMSPRARARYFQQVEPNAELMENVGGKMMNVNVPGVYGLRALAQGGYVQQGEPVIVGDGGQPELFVPDQSGYIYPQVPQQVYRNSRGDGMTQEELDRVTAMQSGGSSQRSPQKQGGFMSMEEYYAQKAAEEAEGRRQQERANWMMRPISQADVSAPEYGHKYYSTLGNQGPEAVAGLPVPKNYAPPIGISVTPEDRGIDPRRAQNGVGLSAMQGQDQGQQQVAPTQVQAAQAILGTIQNGGTLRDTINMVQQVTGTRGNMVPGANGELNLVNDDGRVLHSFRGPQDVVAYAYKHLGDNSGLPDHYLSLNQKEARRKDQMKINEKLVDYMAQIENRNYQRQADREKMDMNSDRNTAEFNQKLYMNIEDHLDKQEKQWSSSPDTLMSPFPREQKRQAYIDSLAKQGITFRQPGGRVQPTSQSTPDSVGEDWSGIPSRGSSQVGLGPRQVQPQEVIPEYRDLYNLEQNMRGQTASPQAIQAQQTMPPPNVLSKLRGGVITKFGNGQAWTIENGNPKRVQ